MAISPPTLKTEENISMKFHGIIEGFYGKPWEWQERANIITLMQQHAGFDTYIYAPKQDRFFRRDWEHPLPSALFNNLQSLSLHCQQQSVQFGIGLSPLNLFSDYSATNKSKLKRKIEQLNQLKPNILCLLFDDMRGDIENLAALQAHICADVVEFSTAKHVIACPTYYSFDPVLEKVFGEMPSQYWEQLALNIPAEVDLFWTGPEVCSTEYPKAHLTKVQQHLNRKPVLWDNYPVNDGEKNCQFLRLAPRTEALNSNNLCQGRLYNPMNQPYLSTIAMLSEAKQMPFTTALQKLCDPALAEFLELQGQELAHTGLKNLPSTKRETLKQQLLHCDAPSATSQHMIQELRDWLDDKYQFDPQCLTE